MRTDTMKGTRRGLIAIIAIALVAAACGGGDDTAAVVGDTTPATTVAANAAAPAETTTAVSAATATSVIESTTTTAASFRLIDLSAEPPPWEAVTIATEDGIDLFGRFWPGNDIAIIFGHDFDNPNPGSAGQRPPQSTETALAYTGALAREGFSVLAFDWRGHGQSTGEYDVPASQIDLKATYGWVEDQGFETIVMIGWVGAGTSAVVLDAADAEVGFDGIALLFSPPQDTGLDADRSLPDIDGLTLFIGSNAGRSGSFSKRMEAKASNSFGAFNFERTPTGLQFNDVFGPELAGRIVAFVEAVAGS